MARADALLATPIVTAPRRGLRIDAAASYVGVGTTKFQEMVDDGRMPKPARIDGCVLWDIRKLDVALDDIFDKDNAPADDPYGDIAV